MTTKISELPSTVLPSGTHEVAAMKDDLTVKLTVDQIINLAAAQILDSAPGSLDTLNELAAALGDDPDFATTVTASIATKLGLAGGTLTGNLSIPTLNPSDASQNAANAAFVQREKIIKKIHTFYSSTTYTRTSTTSGNLSDSFVFTPVSTTSRFLIFAHCYVMTRNTAGVNDARGTLSLAMYNTANAAYVNYKSRAGGLVNVATTGNATLYMYATPNFDVDAGQDIVVYGANSDQVLLKIRGDADYSGTEVNVYDTTINVLEYENAS